MYEPQQKDKYSAELKSMMSAPRHLEWIDCRGMTALRDTPSGLLFPIAAKNGEVGFIDPFINACQYVMQKLFAKRQAPF